MAKVNIIERLIIRHTAKKDANSDLGTAIANGTTSSRYMMRLAERYISDCKRTIAAQEKSVTVLYNKTIREYERIKVPREENLKKQTDDENDLNKLNDQLTEIKDKLKKARNDYDKFNETGKYEEGMVATSLYGVHKVVDDLENQKRQVEEKITKINSKSEKRNNGYSAWEKESGVDMKKYLYAYRNKLDKLTAKLKKLELDYNERLDIYWDKFINYFRGNSKKKTLNELCAEKGARVYTKDSLFKEQRKIINDDVREFSGFKFDV